MKVTNFVIAGLLGCLVVCEEGGYDLPTWTEDWEENADLGFHFCDKDSGGTVSYKEFVKCNKELGNPEDKIDRDFFAMDLNEDQKIDWDEAYLVSKRKYGPQPTVIGDDGFGAYFKWIDDDDDEKLSWREFRSCWDPLYSDWDYHMLESTFKNADFDDSGYLDYNEALDEYQSQQLLDRKFGIVDQGHDGRIDTHEWSDNLLFVSKTSSDAVIRERFAYHDENEDGYLTRDELYHVIRPNQVRWRKFLIFWGHLDPTGDGWTDTSEALDGMREINPETSEYECEQFLKKYDRNSDGRVHKFEMWMAEGEEWDKQRAAENKERAYKEMFAPGWFTYDADRDFSLSWSDVRYVRDLIEDESATEEFWKHFKDVDEVGDKEAVTMAFDEAYGVWKRDWEVKQDFDKHWKTVDSDRNWSITFDDLKAVVGIIPGLTEEKAEEVWQQMVTAGESVVYYHQGCEAFVNRFLCSEDYDMLRRYVEFKDERAPWFDEADQGGDGYIGMDELESAVQADFANHEEIMAYLDEDQDGKISSEDFFRRGFAYVTRDQEAKALWEQIDQEDKGVIQMHQLQEYAYKAEWLQEDAFWEGLDANGDGWISAREYCFAAGGFTHACMELPNEESEEPVFEFEDWLNFLVSWYRVDRDQDEAASESDLRAARDSAFTDAQVSEEFNFYDLDGDGTVGLWEAWDAYFHKLKVHKHQFYDWFWTLNTDGDEYLSSDELANDTRGVVTNTDGTGQFHVDDLCAIWFSEFPYTCWGLVPTEAGDIAPEEFIRSWYAFDKDHDEKAGMTEFINWASQDSEFYNWMSKYEIKMNVWNKMDAPNGEITFSAGLSLYNEVETHFEMLSGIMHILAIDEVDSFDSAYMTAKYQELVTAYPDLEDQANGEVRFQEMDADQDGQVSYLELCRHVVGYGFCGAGEHDHDDGEDSYDWEAEQFFRRKINEWYIIDTDKDEQVSFQDLRDARDPQFDDDSVRAEFNHYDLNGDEVVTFDEAEHVANEDNDNFNSWFQSLASKDGDSYYLEHWEHQSDESGRIESFEAADSDGDWKLTKDEACPHYFSDAPLVCERISWNYATQHVDPEEFVYRWYKIDTDKDESVSFEDLFAWTRTFDWEKYAWMTEEEVGEYMFTPYDADGDGRLSYDEGKAGYEDEREKRAPFDSTWSSINPNWQYPLDSETVETNWEALDESLRQGASTGSDFFNILDLDSNGEVSYDEACVAVTGVRHICLHGGHIWQLDWRVDFNLDRIVSDSEYERAFGDKNDYEYRRKPYWDEWCRKDWTDAAGVSWGHINERLGIESSVQGEWNNTLADHGRNVWLNTTITVAEATEWFSLTTTETVDLNGDGNVHYSEFCMQRIAIEAVCLHEIELTIKHYDVDGSGGVNFDEFLAIMADEENDGDMSDEFMDLYFHFYDMDNDGQIEYEEVVDIQDTMQQIRVFNSTNWLDASLTLMDRNNDTNVDLDEFRTGMNIIRSLVDLDKIEDDGLVQKYYDHVFPVIEDVDDGFTGQKVGMMIFLKEIIKRGISSYDSYITETDA